LAALEGAAILFVCCYNINRLFRFYGLHGNEAAGNAPGLRNIEGKPMPRSIADAMWVQMMATMPRANPVAGRAFPSAVVGWEPPMDVLETEAGVLVIVALPGVRQEDIQVVIASGSFSVRGTRRWPRMRRSALVHQIELPHGQFERKLPLPPGSYRLAGQDHVDGCLLLTLQRLD
jgi:HSP20 family molecular chaperone IbpA